MNRLLINDQAPYFFTILIALIAYQFNYIISYVSEAPLVAYDYKEVNKKIEGNIVTQDLELKIENINRKLNFANIIFYIKYGSNVIDTPAQVYEPQLLAIAPATILPDSVVSTRHRVINRYQIINLQPGGIYVAKLRVRHSKKIDEMPKVYLNSANNVLLTERDIEVNIVRNQFLINITLLCFWICLVLIYLKKMLSLNNANQNAR